MICTLALSCLFLRLHSQSPELICISRFCFYFSSCMKCNRNLVFTRDLTYLNFYHKILCDCFINRKYFSISKTVLSFLFVKSLNRLGCFQVNEKCNFFTACDHHTERLVYQKNGENVCFILLHLSPFRSDQRACMSAMNRVMRSFRQSLYSCLFCPLTANKLK
jgi:hypothetical protein